MIRSGITVAWLLLLALSCVAIGCSRSNRTATYPVHGTLTYKGKPVGGATIEFLAPGASRPATGTTNESGQFRLTTFLPDDGAIVGSHVITVIKTSNQPVATDPAQVDSSPAAIEKAMAQSAMQQKKARSLIPIKYSDRKTTDLHADVAPHENEIELKLVD